MKFTKITDFPRFSVLLAPLLKINGITKPTI